MENEEQSKGSNDQEDKNEELISNDGQIVIIEEKVASEKDRLIAEISKAKNERKALNDKNKELQGQISYTIKLLNLGDFQSSSLPTNANEDTFKNTLESIGDIQKEMEEYDKKMNEELDYFKSEIAKKAEEQKEINDSFVAAKERTALHSMHSENGTQYTKKAVQELLQKEKKEIEIKECLRLESIKMHHMLQTVREKKKNQVEGPLDYGEYEIMCTSTENNTEVIKQLREEIKEITKKASKSVTVHSHLFQKLKSAQSLSAKAEEKEKKLEEELKEMRDQLFKEKLQYTKRNDKNEDLQHKTILLQYPRLIEDYKNIVIENEDARKEIDRLEDLYSYEKELIRG